MVSALVRSGRACEALDQLKTAVRRGKPSAELLYVMADLQEKLLDIDGALNSYRWCLRLRPDFAEAHNDFGCLLLNLGRTPEAIESFRAAVVVNPKDLRALSNLGNALLKASEPIPAAECLERALSIRPDYPLALCNLGLVRLAQGKYHEAADLFTRVIAIDSTVAEAHYGLGSALRKSGRFFQALASFDLPGEVTSPFSTQNSEPCGGSMLLAQSRASSTALRLPEGHVVRFHTCSKPFTIQVMPLALSMSTNVPRRYPRRERLPSKRIIDPGKHGRALVPVTYVDVGDHERSGNAPDAEAEDRVQVGYRRGTGALEDFAEFEKRREFEFDVCLEDSDGDHALPQLGSERGRIAVGEASRTAPPRTRSASSRKSLGGHDR
jgi:Tfp pilus assembly protein PilF